MFSRLCHSCPERYTAPIHSPDLRPLSDVVVYRTDGTNPWVQNISSVVLSEMYHLKLPQLPTNTFRRLSLLFSPNPITATILIHLIQLFQVPSLDPLFSLHSCIRNFPKEKMDHQVIYSQEASDFKSTLKT